MYLSYFSFNDKPFSIAPDPRYLYMSQQHEEALAHLLYGLQGEGGIVLLTGEVGTGKTTMVRKLLEELPETLDLAWIINPKLSVLELLESICDELGIAHQDASSIKTFTDCISKHLLDTHAQGKHTVLMIDEAQNLIPEVLEQLRLLTNLETNERKLLQIVLIGQPELQDMLNRYDLRQFSQRITARFHLDPLTKYETSFYIQHRLHVAGCEKKLFSKRVAKKIYQLSRGIPRLINLICDRALLGAYARSANRVQIRHVKQAYHEVLGQSQHQRFKMRPIFIYAPLLVILLLLQLFLWNPQRDSEIEVLNEHDKAVTLAPPTSTIKTLESIEPTKIKITDEQAISSESAALVLVDSLQEVPPSMTIQPISVWQNIAEEGTQTLALQTLAALWGIKVGDDARCKALAEKQFPCLRQRTDFARLKDLDRPAMIRLHNLQQGDYYAVLRGLDGESSTLSLGEQSWEVSAEALKARWYADFTILWRAPPMFDEAIRLGDRGEEVRWLGHMLDQIQGEMIPAQNFSSMNEIMVERLKDFQRQAGLTSDGVAGPQTLIRINDAVDIQRPRLFGHKGAS